MINLKTVFPSRLLFMSSSPWLFHYNYPQTNTSTAITTLNKEKTQTMLPRNYTRKDKKEVFKDKVYKRHWNSTSSSAYRNEISLECFSITRLLKHKISSTKDCYPFWWYPFIYLHCMRTRVVDDYMSSIASDYFPYTADDCRIIVLIASDGT